MRDLPFLVMPFVNWLLPNSVRMHVAISLAKADPPEEWAVSLTAAQMVRAQMFAVMVPLYGLLSLVAIVGS